VPSHYGRHKNNRVVCEMSKGQWRVLVLLLVLLGLEVLRSPNVRTFFSGLLKAPISNTSLITTTGTQNTSKTTQTTQSTQSTQQQQINKLIGINR
jgi:hypothetical protein